ncbi:hypothetical protein G647_05307 [Cladophialophora carrionii CBS 160.54]|uniref:Uncharacterized protein n=1 Tax=Cladophialophora carrionii CBS 160.54 TaxID=1279043 RepID=V9D9J2_9EURO|nr:uncharacterized protein G647_05307 [Cladophialophora carrionii CBS 160.54]ETI23505.1 hypothetical protein G647_05307 [Cladophialophora carrionii CBS 160.54]
MADNQKFEPPSGPPPGLALQAPPQVHHDAGPYYPPDAAIDNTRGPQKYPPAQDPSGGYLPPQGWNQGPPGGPWQGPPGQQPPYGYYGPPGPQQGMYYQQGPPVVRSGGFGRDVSALKRPPQATNGFLLEPQDGFMVRDVPGFVCQHGEKHIDFQPVSCKNVEHGIVFMLSTSRSNGGQ